MKRSKESIAKQKATMAARKFTRLNQFGISVDPVDYRSKLIRLTSERLYSDGKTVVEVITYPLSEK